MKPEQVLIMSKNRVEALSDGVIAIILTLLILEIKIPEIHTTSNSVMLHKLSDKIPLFITYFLSFAVISMFWISHHFLFAFGVKNVDRIVVLLNFLSLAALSIIPFSSHFLGSHLDNSVASAFYGFNMLAVSFSFMFLYAYIWKSDSIINGELSTRTKKQGKIRQALNIGFNTLGIIFSFIYIPFALFCYLFPVFFNIIPGLLNFTEKMLGITIE